MNRNDLKKDILFQDVDFFYNDVDCAFCPIDKYLVRFGNNRYEFDNIDEAIDAPIFDGKSLAEIADKIVY